MWLLNLKVSQMKRTILETNDMDNLKIQHRLNCIAPKTTMIRNDKVAILLGMVKQKNIQQNGFHIVIYGMDNLI